MSKLSNAIISIFRKGEKRISSEQFESAVNQVLLSETVGTFPIHLYHKTASGREQATNNNIEHQGMEFVQYCLLPYLVRLEEEFNRKLLREDEFGSITCLLFLPGNE